MSRRQDRVNELLKHSISEILSRELKDPRLDLTLISITEVDISPDLRSAHVYVSVMGDNDQDHDAIFALNHSRGFIRRLLAPHLSMRNIPTLPFSLDTRLAEDQRMSTLIDSLAHEKRENNTKSNSAPSDEI